jgi:hypothetical protein
MTLNEWVQFFRARGFKRTGSYNDYERGKQQLRRQDMTPLDYQRAIQALAKVVGV